MRCKGSRGTIPRRLMYVMIMNLILFVFSQDMGRKRKAAEVVESPKPVEKPSKAKPKKEKKTKAKPPPSESEESDMGKHLRWCVD